MTYASKKTDWMIPDTPELQFQYKYKQAEHCEQHHFIDYIQFYGRKENETSYLLNITEWDGYSLYC